MHVILMYNHLISVVLASTGLVVFRERFNQDIINKVAEFKKFVIDVSDNENVDRNEYISEWDFIEKIHDLLNNNLKINSFFILQFGQY